MKSHSPSTSVVALGAIAAFLACMFPQSAMAKNDPAGVSGLIVPVIEFPTPDYAFLEQDDIRRDLDGLPMRFAVPNATLITPVNSGIWDRTIEGRLRWQLRVGSKGVPHINLGFEEWNMSIFDMLFAHWKWGKSKRLGMDYKTPSSGILVPIDIKTRIHTTGFTKHLSIVKATLH